MNRLSLLLALAATSLLGVIALELQGADTAAESVIIASRPVIAGQARPPDEAGNHVAEWASTILARPLFSRERRPPAQSRSRVAAAGPALLPRLSGVLVSSAGRSAMFQGATGERSIVVGEGARIGRYTVQKIEAGRVTVAGPEGTSVLRPYVEKAAGVGAATYPSAGAGSAPGRPGPGSLPGKSQPASLRAGPNGNGRGSVDSD